MTTDWTTDELLTGLNLAVAAEAWQSVAVLLEMLHVVAPEVVYAIRDELWMRCPA